MKVTRTELAPLVFLTCVNTGKFKTGCLSLYMLDQLTRENAARNALIPYVLRRGSALHPDMESVSAALDELYGAHIEPSVIKRGEIQLSGFTSTFIDDAFVPGGGGVLRDTAALLCELLLEPNTRGGLLLPQYVESERDKLLDRIRGVINDKRSYSMHRLRELMCFGEDYAVEPEGTEAEAEVIGYQRLTRQHRELLTNAPIEIVYCGSADPELVAGIFSSLLETLPRSGSAPDMGTDIRLNTVEAEPRRYTDELDVTQGKLAIGFRLGEYFEEEHIPAIRVMNAVYGGTATSKLFMNVREKLSLCYFASSGIDIFKGLMFVSSGIEFDKREEAEREIFAQLDAVRRGDTSPEELRAAKKIVSSDLRAVADSPSQLVSFWLNQGLRGLDASPEDEAALAEAVTAEEVAEAAKSVECDAIYFLKGMDKEAGDALD